MFDNVFEFWFFAFCNGESNKQKFVSPFDGILKLKPIANLDFQLFHFG